MTRDRDTTPAADAVPVESLPPGPISMDLVESLDESDAITIAAPLVLYTSSSRVTHVDLVVDGTHHFLGWNPTASQWERIVVVTDEDDHLSLESAITVPNGASDPILEFDPDDGFETSDVVAFVWDYVEYTYDDLDGLYNAMDDALAELDTTEE